MTPYLSPQLTCLVQVVSSHLKQTQVHVGYRVKGAAGQEHHRDSILHHVRPVHICHSSGHSVLLETELHVRVGATKTNFPVSSLKLIHRVPYSPPLKDVCLRTIDRIVLLHLNHT